MVTEAVILRTKVIPAKARGNSLLGEVVLWKKSGSSRKPAKRVWGQKFAETFVGRMGDSFSFTPLAIRRLKGVI